MEVEEVQPTMGSWLMEMSSKGQTKVGGGRGVAVVAWSRWRHLVDSYLVQWKN